MTTKTHKVCLECSIEKPISEFYLNNKPEHSKGRSWNPRCKPCFLEKQRKEYNPVARRNSKLKSAYGITLEDYEQMLFLQNGLCAICKTNTPNGKDSVFHVDHNHNTGKVRGLLCHSCNVGIGSLKEDINTLKSAIKYLELFEGGE